MSNHEPRTDNAAASGAAPDAGPPLTDETFIRRFKTMVPADVALSFDDTQLKAIATVFGARRWRRHAIDRRVVIPLFGRNFYFIALAGGEQRSAAPRESDRLRHPLATAGNAVFAVIFFVSILFSALAVLYVLKSFLGIDLFPGSSLGIMVPIKEQFELFFR